MAFKWHVSAAAGTLLILNAEFRTVFSPSDEKDVHLIELCYVPLVSLRFRTCATINVSEMWYVHKHTHTHIHTQTHNLDILYLKP